MCSESHYCTLVEYIICHAAFTGCHLAERLQCSWKPLSASNDIIKIGARGTVGAGRRHHRGCRFPCPEMHLPHAPPAPREPRDGGCGSTDPPLEPKCGRTEGTRMCRGPGHPCTAQGAIAGAGVGTLGRVQGAARPCPCRTSTHLLEGSNLWTPSPPRPAPGLPFPR